MRKTLVLALMAALALTGSAFAAPHNNNFVGKANLTFAFGAPATTDNNSSCDIGTTPAATLLLPYFEVDVANTNRGLAQTTLFTIVNTSSFPQIAHVVVWTDWSYPVLDFNVFLTGYDVQALNLYDVLVSGVVAPPSGTTSSETANPSGAFSELNNSNPNFAATIGCGTLPGQLPTSLVADVRSALTTGVYSLCGTSRIGSTHANAIGYVTVDVANNCSTSLPNQPAYFSNELLFDNVLTGDYQQINPNPTTGNYAGGNPLVSIRAEPEGGPAGTPGVTTNLPYTFYDRYTPTANRTVDRRQPLPGVFAARFIQGGASSFSTNLKIWREGVTTGAAACSAYISNATLLVSAIVRFDEHENPTTGGTGTVCSPCGPSVTTLPETSAFATSSSVYPNLSTSGDVAGWIYLNLSNNSSNGTTNLAALSAARPGFGAGAAGTTYFNTGGVFAAGVSGTRATSQNWVITSFFAEGRYSVDFDAAWLANGCTPQALYTGPTSALPSISPDDLICPAGATCTPTNPNAPTGFTYIPPPVNP
ncbi:MAG: hypothetical protein ACXV5L_02280 [Thermoanaerobaculia bacterium]